MDENRKFRHELKYQCSEAHLAIIRNRLQGVIPYDRHAANGQYTIRSMYFDNFENRCFHENESGTDPREKFRIRIYNADDSRISLECKRKERGKKEREQDGGAHRKLDGLSKLFSPIVVCLPAGKNLVDLPQPEYKGFIEKIKGFKIEVVDASREKGEEYEKDS